MSLRHQSPARGRQILIGLVAAGSLSLCVSPAPAAGGDQGTGTYTASGAAYAFDLLNNGTTAWQYFYVIGPPAVSFVGGATAGESTAHCVVGEPGGLPNEIECGPLATTGLAPGSRVLLVATANGPAVCGATFQIGVSSVGAPNGAETTDNVPPGTCSVPPSIVEPPRVIERPAVHGTPVAGGVLSSSAAIWSAPPGRNVYQWELCSPACRRIAGATAPTLRLTRHEVGHTVRLEAMANVSGIALTAVSEPVLIRPKR